MINQEQLITPPQLVEQWIDMLFSRSDYTVFSLAAQWGWDQHCAATEAELQQAADQELEACLERILDVELADQLRAARRLKPPEPSKPPTNEELYEYWISTSPQFGCADPVGFARAVIERWGK